MAKRHKIPESGSSASKKEKKKKTRGSDSPTLEDLKLLGQQLLTSRSHINNVSAILSFLSPSSPIEFALESLISLQAFFTPLIPDIPPATTGVRKGKSDPEPELVYKSWLRARYDEFLGSLTDIVCSIDSSDTLMEVALDAFMELVKQGKDGRFQSAIYHRFLHNVVHSVSPADPVLDLIVSKYFSYIDVSYFTYTSMDKISRDLIAVDDVTPSMDDASKHSKSRMEITVQNIYAILSRISPLELLGNDASKEMWSQSGLSLKKAEKASLKVLISDEMPEKLADTTNEVLSGCRVANKLKVKFTKAWLSFLKLPLPLEVYKEVLSSLHQNVIPYISNPAVLCDFLSKSYDIGGVISVMALSGLFILMTQHGLEYPKFYEKLYALLTPLVFMTKHRAVFFQLLDTCLKSAYLPAYLAAAFVKKLSRLALSIPPSGVMVVIALIHNFLRRHPSINFLVHQTGSEGDTVEDSVPPRVNEPGENGSEPTSDPTTPIVKDGVDPFNDEESDLLKSNAMRSSLWEIDTLRHHYLPQASRFVSSLESDLTIRAKTSEVAVADFSSGSYASIFKLEMRRRVKQVPLAFYRTTPSSLFSESEFPGWTFGGLHDNAANELMVVMKT